MTFRMKYIFVVLMKLMKRGNGMFLGCDIQQEVGQITSGVGRERKGIDRKEEVEERGNGKRKWKRI